MRCRRQRRFVRREVFGVFEVDVDSTNVYARTRSCECVVVVEDSGEAVDGLALVVDGSRGLAGSGPR